MHRGPQRHKGTEVIIFHLLQRSTIVIFAMRCGLSSVPDLRGCRNSGMDISRVAAAAHSCGREVRRSRHPPQHSAAKRRQRGASHSPNARGCICRRFAAARRSGFVFCAPGARSYVLSRLRRWSCGRAGQATPLVNHRSEPWFRQSCCSNGQWPMTNDK